MPGISLVSRQTMSCSRGSNSFQREPQLSEEERVAAEESLLVYCRPVEFYNILQRRAIKNPLFLQRCLSYKLQAKIKKMIQVSVSISGATDDAVQTQSLFPFYILLARPIPNTSMERSAVYHFSKASKLTAFSGAETASSAQAKLILPEINELSAEIKSGSLAMLLVSCVDITSSQEIDLANEDMFSSLPNAGGYCLLGQIPMDLLLFERSTNLSLRERAETMSNVSMRSCYMKLSGSGNEKCVAFQFPHNSEVVSILQQVPVIVSAEEIRAKEDTSAYDLHSSSDIPDNSLSRKMRLKAGNVIFHYKYYNDMLHKTEVTEDFSCPICLVKGASFKGLKFHLTSCHDLFRFDWANEDCQVVSVSVKADEFNSHEMHRKQPLYSYVIEIAGNRIDPRKDAFSFCQKGVRIRIMGQTQNANPAPLLDSDSPNTTFVSSDKFAEPDSVQSVPPSVPQFPKNRKLSVERSDPKNLAHLKKRQFFHSHRTQPMALEQVLSEHDSEDEVDHDVADLEDRRMLDDFDDVTSDEKHLMHLWNSFIRKQRVLADSHTPWACKAFSNQHGQLFVQNPELLWCWRLMMIKLWNHGLLDPQAMNSCNVILEHHRSVHPSTAQV